MPNFLYEVLTRAEMRVDRVLCHRSHVNMLGYAVDMEKSSLEYLGNPVVSESLVELSYYADTRNLV